MELRNIKIYFLECLFYGFEHQITDNSYYTLPEVLIPSQVRLSLTVLREMGFKELDGVLNSVHELDYLLALFLLEYDILELLVNCLVPSIDLSLQSVKVGVVAQVRLNLRGDRLEHPLPLQNGIARALKIVRGLGH